ncbi:hypothetical protein [Thermogemmatispora tikiterensis]|uniref:Uncharacterized protein n=1 Tax=Thermogemmatispora tikiterensis TaxID=1825093 RepID=A0A328VQH4_9CHLR|nr:hypothetical protein [Thermogemmatispora tikiterensis]RAQ97494.1 hypothetical protein A4R35_18300 [Thermogemmatispora tikiterensis]
MRATCDVAYEMGYAVGRERADWAQLPAEALLEQVVAALKQAPVSKNEPAKLAWVVGVLEGIADATRR